MTATTRPAIPAPRDRPVQVPAAVWDAVHTTTRPALDCGRDTDGWVRCGAFEIRFDSNDDRRDR